MIIQIEDFFLETENLIKFQLQDNIENNSDIKKKFKEGKKLIDELEEDDVEQYRIFKHKYHTIYAIYLKTVGEVDNAIKQQNLVKEYEKYTKKPEGDNYKTDSILFKDATLDVTQDFNSEETSMIDDVKEKLGKIQNILGDNIIETIKQVFNQFNETPKTFKMYQQIIEYGAILHKTIDSLIIEGLESSQNSEANEIKEQLEQNKNNHELLFDSLNCLKLLADKATYSKRIDFIQYVLNSSNKKEILFSNILFTEEGINKHSRKLSSYFHPDKTNQPNTPNFLQDEHKSLGAELFKIIQEFKELLLADLKVVSNLSFHEIKANELWKITIDYHNAAKGKWEKLKTLKKEDIEGFSSEELENLCVEKGELAYQEYRAACQIADKAKQLKKQVKLRGNMALCYYVINKFLEAQLYALSAIRLQLKYSQEVTKQDLIEAKNIFDKVKGGNSIKKTPKLNTEINLKNNSDDALALTKIVDQEFSFYEKKCIECSLNEDMEKLNTELMLKADPNLVRYQASKEEILNDKNRAQRYEAAGSVAMGAGMRIGGIVAAAGMRMGGIVAATANFNVYKAVIFGAATFNFSVFLVAGLATLGLGIFCGHLLWKKGALLIKEPEIREKLNKIMVNALNMYAEEKHQEFLDQLSEEFDEKGTRLFKLKEHDDDIDPKYIIDELLSHGFRSDGIAYLLNLLGEVLSSGKVKIEGKTKNELKELAKKVFLGVTNKKLEDESEKLDNRIHELRTKSYLVNTLNKFIDTVLLREHSDLAKEHKDDAQEMPFRSRLEEMRNIAKINLTIFDILNGGKDEFDRAIKIIKEVRDSMNRDHQFISTAKSRLEVLEDFLWVISAVYYEQLAEKESKVNQLNSLKYWYHAQRNYESIRALDPKNLDATLSFAKCLLKLSKYARVIKLFNTNSDLTSLSEYWRYCSISHCKKINYKKANECIVHSLRLDPKNNLAGEQREFLKKLNKDKINYRIHRYEWEKKTIKYEKNYLENTRNNNSPIYNILSIDGGGIRGILPALWLSEIEHRTHRPISHLFNMITGTSTGGLIAAGLSAPYLSSDMSYYSDFKPKFSALKLLNFYQDQAKDLNTVSDFDRYYRKHFGQTTLSRALTELVIPALHVNENKLKQKHLFTRYDALNDSSKDDTFVDVLMATTAAPTFFPPYNIKDKGYFLDGGIHLNNPSLIAYDKAIIYGVKSEKISVLSLGTGSYIPDPLKPDLYLDKLFWPKYSNNAQEVNTDSQMYDILGSRYQRWQVFLEDPVGFHDLKSIPGLLEIGNQYIEELYASDENPMNKLVESFDKVL
ncbi:hypothetical protein C1645_873892 [Glomus cerebriforme]|uniref:PNPLA domain-containing protein n=1 Tax=Glomus cerebriforme TaxID=658196 RepID=A0A397TBX5_9GLOM|nr:hypothetical protein C1645_873892 [Glomus cerebriforme]